MVPYGPAQVSFVWFTAPKKEGTLSGLEMSQHSEHRCKYIHVSPTKTKGNKQKEAFVLNKIRDCHQDEVIKLHQLPADKQFWALLFNKDCISVCGDFSMAKAIPCQMVRYTGDRQGVEVLNSVKTLHKITL